MNTTSSTMPTPFKNPALMAAVAAVAAGALQASSFTDNFESNSQSEYTVVTSASDDGSYNFGFDYVAAGIPLAPRSTAGDRLGLRLTANDSGGAADTVTVFRNLSVSAPSYTFKVDVYMGFTGTAGTTEHAHVGVGGDGATPNSLFTPVSGSGSFIAFDGDGGSASDYRWFLDAAHGGPTTYPNSDASYLGNGSNNTGAFYQSLYPSTTVPGSPGNTWTTVEVSVDNVNQVVQYRLDGQLVFDSTPNGAFTGTLDGLVSVGLHDPFTSVDPGTVFTLFDNLELVAVPEPEEYAALFGGALLAGAFLRRRLARR